MKSQVKKIVMELLRELSNSDQYYSGGMQPPWKGGPFGAGHKNQLATSLDPSVARIEDQEQEEIGQNIEDQQWGLSKFSNFAGEPFQDVNARPKNEKDFLATKGLEERTSSDMQYGHLPGFPGMNALESPVQHLPNENLPVDDLRAGGQDGTESYLIDDIIDELERDGKPEYRMEESVLPPYEDPEDEEETIGHMATDKATSSPPGGYGQVIFPRKFVPDEATQESDLVDDDMDGIADTIDMNQPPELRQRVTEDMENEGKSKSIPKSTRHRERYGPKTPSGAQIAKKFKVARRALIELGQVLDGGLGMGEAMRLINDLNAMEKRHGIDGGTDE